MSDPVGEDGWLALVDEASRTAGDLESRVRVVELYKRAIVAEPWSIKLWLAYCEWFWSLYTDCQNGDAGWPQEEQELGQQIFSLQEALDVWQQGAQATQYRLNDSHELFNRWISIELEVLSRAPTTERIERVRQLFFDRLLIPHATWDETSQMLSTFVTKFDEAGWEATMVEATNVSKAAKELYSNRESHELKLHRAVESGDPEAVKSEMLAYLAWETFQPFRKIKKGEASSPMILCVALYERALCSTSLGLDSTVWEDYVVYLTNNRHVAEENQLPRLLPVIQRATNHCPWSGALWARYILSAESESLPFSTMEQIKHAATNTRELDRDGIDSVIEFYIAWCGYLKRLTMVAGATDDDIDVAEMGLPTALEDVREWGKRRHGAEWKGDPLFRIERIYIEHLTHNGSYEEARSHWKRLALDDGPANNYEFWLQYYLWELIVRNPSGPPSHATGVLIQAINRRTVDWPEKIMETCLRHCNNYEEVDTLLKVMGTVHRLSRVVAARRAKQNAEAAAMYAQQQPQAPGEIAIEPESPSGALKRKRESASEDAGVKKKIKGADQSSPRDQHLKRDRENTTVVVTNLPPDVTLTKLRQYWKEYGHLNNVTMKTEADKQSTTAHLEFRTPEEAQSALLRDGRYFGDRQLQVTPGTGLTLYVTNYPPTTDEAYLRELFKDCGEIFSVRWPSLKFNTHRRFCYVTFRTPSAAAAATTLDGKSLGDFYKLVAKYSDPAARKTREGAVAEGREIHITGLDSSITEDELKLVFSKYGEVERVNILKKYTGVSKGAAFVAFGRKEDATAALEMNMTKLKSTVLRVETSLDKNFKTTSTILGKASSASPAPDGGSAMSPSPAPDAQQNVHTQHAPAPGETSNRTMCLLNIPDTINDARVRAIVEPYGEVVKLELRLDHQGAIIEYADAASAGRAALALENHEIVPGRKLGTGGMKDLFSQRGETRTDRIQVGRGKKPAGGFVQPAAPIRRPGTAGRGGLGQKKGGLGFAAQKTSGANSTHSNSHVPSQSDGETKPKSNADFKAMFVNGGTK